MPWLRGADRLHRAAREGRRAKDPRPRARGHKGNRGRGGGSVVSSLTDRIRGIVVPASARSSAGSAHPAPADLSTLGGDWCGDCFVVDRRWSPSARYGKEAVGTFAQCLEEASAE